MKQRNILIFTILIVISIICIILTNYNKNDVVIENKKIKNYYTNSISMNFETEAGSGIYEEVKNNDWPLKGYIFNNLLSKCERGSEIIWDSVNKRVQVSSITSDKCYVYFDKVILPSVKVSSTNGSASAITVNVAGTKGTYNIAKYMYSIDNKKTWVTKTTSATTSSHTFSVLNSNTEYTIYVKIVDVENNESEIISTKVRTEVTGAQKIKNLFTTQGANNLYHHDGTLANGINDGSYRYAGTYDAVNNWVCFGTTATTCDNEHLYRIIGVFNNQLKLIKAYEGTQASLGTTSQGNVINKDTTYYKGTLNPSPGYYWSGSSSNSSNDWTKSTLNSDILNGTYLATLETKWTDMIATNEWKIGGNTYKSIRDKTAAIAFQNEILNPTENTGGNKVQNKKIGLMYASDYGFAASPENWTTVLYDYNNNTNRENNWMYFGIMEWCITASSDYPYQAFAISNNGHVQTKEPGYDTSILGVRPTFYLESSVGITSGTGTKTNPYRIS